MSSTTPTRIPTQFAERTDDSLTWYFMGETLSSVPADLNRRSVDLIKERLPNYTPTTWEAIMEKQDEESRKPEAERNRCPPMCLMLVVKVPRGQKVAVINRSIGAFTVVQDGTSMCFTALSYPPNVFGTRENFQSGLLVDPDTGEPRQATIMMSYFAPSI
ncbi:hypothetical protein BDZ94DRAFT_1268824 [Collybia nuda]|uniref:Uncharacterized protein n=1 Tax=Collybia nuda TaxID=64659 RepID=A0A9P5Y0Q7_9AGAR|nr:hypothetical protein BDZ94DRAFT_1268824 [Collybia nuda]